MRYLPSFLTGLINATAAAITLHYYIQDGVLSHLVLCFMFVVIAIVFSQDAARKI